MVVIEHKGKTFVGTSTAHPEEPCVSSFFGCEIAELRAEIAALKYERKILKQKSDAAIDLLKSCECYANFDKDSPTAKVLYRQIKQRIKAVNKLADEINNRYLLIQQKVSNRKNVIDNLNKIKKVKEGK